MAMDVAQLINAGALAYALMLMTRDTPSGVIEDKLARKYPGQPRADLIYMIELAQQQESARAELAAAAPLDFLGPAQIPLIPGLPAGQFEIDVAYQVPGLAGHAAQRGFYRAQLDGVDATVGLIFFLAGSPQQRPGAWLDLREQITQLPHGIEFSDMAEILESANVDINAIPPHIAHEPVPVRWTPAALQEAMIRVPSDEPERIIFPSTRDTPRQGRVETPELRFIGRG
jgi:hypothetical protein